MTEVNGWEDPEAACLRSVCNHLICRSLNTQSKADAGYLMPWFLDLALLLPHPFGIGGDMAKFQLNASHRSPITSLPHEPRNWETETT